MRMLVALLLMIGACAIVATGRGVAGEDEALPPPPPPPVVEETPPAVTPPAVEVPPADPDTPAPPDEPPADPATTPADGDGEATTGWIKVARLRVRAGPSTTFEEITVLPKETPVTIHGRQGDWYKIAYPTNQPCFIGQQVVEGEIPADIPAIGLDRQIAAQTAPVYVRPWDRSTVVGTLTQGDTVTVTGVRGLLLKINPPPGVRAWVSAKYVRTEAAVAATEGDTDVPAAPKSPKSERQKQLEAKLATHYKAMADAGEARRKARQQRLDRIAAEIDAKLAAIQAEEALETAIETEAAAQTPQALQPGDAKASGVTGWIEYAGGFGRHPTRYRLRKGGVTLYYLRSAMYDLNDYRAKRVWVSGPVETLPDSVEKILVVEALEIRDESPLNTTPPSKAAPVPGVPAVEETSFDRRESSLPETITVRERETATVDLEPETETENRAPLLVPAPPPETETPPPPLPEADAPATMPDDEQILRPEPDADAPRETKSKVVAEATTAETDEDEEPARKRRGFRWPWSRTRETVGDEDLYQDEVETVERDNRRPKASRAF